MGRLRANVLRRPAPSVTQTRTLLDLQYHSGENLGDWASSPFVYYGFDAQTVRYDFKHELSSEFPHRHPMLIGGGGLVWPPGRRNFERLREQKQSPIVTWGIGLNLHYARDRDSYRHALEGFDVNGVRDFGTQYPWVPCASCLHPAFDSAPETTREGVIWEVPFRSHTGNPPTLPSRSNPRNFPVSGPCHSTMRQAVDFLASAEVVITNSYHGMYWATLLGRKVVVVPHHDASKFFFFKYPHIMATADDWADRIDQARSYSGSLEECREVNRRHARQVESVIGIPMYAKRDVPF